jgi:hypothetical protein
MRDPFEYEASVLRAPQPDRQSMYFGEGEVGGEDPFGDEDEGGEDGEDEFEVGEEVEGKGRRMSKASTRWEELYKGGGVLVTRCRRRC